MREVYKKIAGRVTVREETVLLVTVQLSILSCTKELDIYDSLYSLKNKEVIPIELRSRSVTLLGRSLVLTPGFRSPNERWVMEVDVSMGLLVPSSENRVPRGRTPVCSVCSKYYRDSRPTRKRNRKEQSSRTRTPKQS